MSTTDCSALIAAALTGLPPQEQGAALADLLRTYVWTWHQLDPTMPPEKIGQLFADLVRETLAQMVEQAESSSPTLH